MKLVINIKETKTAIKEVDVYRKKKYEGKDVRFTNVNLLKLNEILSEPLFYKNDVFINSETLWELMQDLGGSGKHNYHDLTAEDIITALKSIAAPYAVIDNQINRYAIITTTLSHFNEPLMIVIEIGGGLFSNSDANINKIVTIYPRNNVDSMLENLTNKKLYYKK